MWIRTQNKQKLVNSDQIIDIFINKTGKEIYAETTDDGDFIILGEYSNRDICNKILDDITEAMMCVMTSYQMPSKEHINGDSN